MRDYNKRLKQLELRLSQPANAILKDLANRPGIFIPHYPKMGAYIAPKVYEKLTTEEINNVVSYSGRITLMNPDEL